MIEILFSLAGKWLVPLLASVAAIASILIYGKKKESEGRYKESVENQLNALKAQEETKKRIEDATTNTDDVDAVRDRLRDRLLRRKRK